MKKHTENNIEYLANAIRELCSIKGPITNMQTVLAHMDATADAVPYLDLLNNGRIIKRGDQFSIRYLDRLNNSKDVNWLVARTLGHIILHFGWGIDLKRWRSIPDANIFIKASLLQDEQAEQFAMELLLPEDVLEPLFDIVTGEKEEISFDDLDIIADYFNVPTIKIFRRLTELDLIE